MRVYADDDGESHVEDLTALMTAVESAPLAPPITVSAFAPATAYGFLTAPPGWEDEWHPAPRRQIIVYLYSSADRRRIGVPGAGAAAVGAQRAVPLLVRSTKDVGFICALV